MRTLRVQELRHQALMERLEKVWPVARLSVIYRAFCGDEWAQRRVTIEQAELYHYEVYMTFYEFIRMNWLPVYEEVLR